MLLPVAFALAFVVVGGYLLVRSATAPELALRLLRTRTGRVADLMSDLPARVCLEGTVEALPGGTVRGPFSGREAVALDYEVQELETSYNAATKTTTSSWEPVHGGTTDRPFVLHDASGRVRVVPAGAFLSLELDDRIEVDGGDRPPERIRRFIEVSDAVDSEETGIDVGPFRIDTGEDRRYVERRLEPGDDVLVFGRATAVRGDVGMVNAELRAGEDQPLLVADGRRRAVVGRLLLGSVVPLLAGLVFVGVGLFVLATVVGGGLL